MTYVNTEEMRRAAATADSAADCMRRSANTVDEAVRSLSQMFEQGYGGPGLRLIELLEDALPALERVQVADLASWKARALEAENTVLKWEARATALDHENLHAILSALEDPQHQAEEEAEKAFYRNEGLELAAAAAEDTEVAQQQLGGQVYDDGGQTRSDIVAAIRALKTPLQQLEADA
jgi:hypothetical protein